MLGLVSDNDNKMVLMCKMVHQAYGCNAHYLNLVKEAITPSSVKVHVIYRKQSTFGCNLLETRMITRANVNSFNLTHDLNT